MASKGILIVLNSMVAEGCPQLALQLADHWQKQGCRVDLICLESQPTDLQSEFECLGIPIHFFHLGTGLGRYPRLAWLTFRLCRRLKPSAVLSFPLGWHSFIALGARLARVKRICAHVGNLPPVWTGPAFTKFKTLVQLGRPFTSRLLCCSQYIRIAAIRDFGLTPREARAIYNACDLRRFIPSLGPKLSHQPYRICMVGRFEQHKDQPTLIRAVARLRAQGIDTDLWLIGDGSYRGKLEALISQLQLIDRVRLLGSRRDIPELLNQVDLFVFSARRDEGFGIALAEAMATCVPIVATDVGACREVLDDGRCGVLVKPDCADALALGIRQVLDDPASARQRAISARDYALANFNMSAMAEAYGHELGLG